MARTGDAAGRAGGLRRPALPSPGFRSASPGRMTTSPRSSSSTHTSPFTRAFPPRGMTMHVSRSPRVRMRDRPGHGTVPQLVTGLRRSIRHVSVPRSVVFPAQLRSFCSRTARAVAGFVRPRRHPMPAPSSIAGMTFAGTITPGLRSGLQCLTGTPRPFSAGRRTIFCNGPRHGALRRLSMPATPVPPRRIAMRCSRGGTGVILAWFPAP
jgi:hypothetical protein